MLGENIRSLQFTQNPEEIDHLEQREAEIGCTSKSFESHQNNAKATTHQHWPPAGRFKAPPHSLYAASGHQGMGSAVL